MAPGSKLLLLLVLFFTCSPLKAQTSKPCKVTLEAPNPASSLVLDLGSSKRSYSLADELNLTALLRNECTVERIFVGAQLRWGSGSGMVLRIEDASGQEVKSPIDNLPGPPLLDDPAPLVGLRLGQTFGIRLKGPARDFFPSPGKYRVQVIYSSVLRRDLVNGAFQNLNILWQGHDPIASPWINVKVTP